MMKHAGTGRTFLILLIVLTLFALPAYTEDSAVDKAVEKAMEAAMPFGNLMHTLNEIADDDSLTVAQKYSKTLTALMTDAAGAMMKIPGIKGYLNEKAQEIVDRLGEDGFLEKDFANISANDQEKMDMYLKAADKTFDNIKEKVAEKVETVVDTVKETAVSVAGTVVETVVDAVESVTSLFKKWF